MDIPSFMQAMVLHKAGSPLVLSKLPVPVPGQGQVLIKVIACGICRTDLHIIDGELPHPKLPLIPGHEIVGRIVSRGDGVTTFSQGDAVGVPWLGYTCGECRFCMAGQENLCNKAMFTGYTIDGGFSEFTVVDARYCFPMPEPYVNTSGAPLLCAGLIGYRSYRMIDPKAVNIGIYGFGAAAHILVQVGLSQGKQIFAFTREGDAPAQAFAKQLGACWAGGSSQVSPVKLDAAIIFAPAGELVPIALANCEKAGVVICGGIHMSEIPAFPYHLLWEERMVRSVANLTRNDAHSFLTLAPQVPVRTAVTEYRLAAANEAIRDLRRGAIHGAAVIHFPS